MKISEAVSKETRHIAVGEVIGVGLMFLVFVLLKCWDNTVLLGGILGGGYAVVNFLLMGLAMQRAMDDRDRAKAIVQRSYTLRMLGMVAVMILGAAVPWFHLVAVVVPLLFPQLTILAMRLLGLYQPEQKGGEEE